LGAILTLRMTAATIAPILPERQGQVKPGCYEEDSMYRSDWCGTTGSRRRRALEWAGI